MATRVHIMVKKAKRAQQAVVERLSRGASLERQTTNEKRVAVKSKMMGRMREMTNSDSKFSAGEQRHRAPP